MSRRLTRVCEVSPDVSRRCHEKGIYTCRHLLELGPFAVRHELDLFGADARELLQEVHNQFIDAVRAGRGKRLGDNPSLFSGLLWSGERSVQLGLVDGLGSASYVARELIGEETIRDFTPSKGLLDSLMDRLGVARVEGWYASMPYWRGQIR